MFVWCTYNYSTVKFYNRIGWQIKYVVRELIYDATKPAIYRSPQDLIRLRLIFYWERNVIENNKNFYTDSETYRTVTSIS